MLRRVRKTLENPGPIRSPRRGRAAWWMLASMLVVIGVAAACSKGGDAENCPELNARLQECGIAASEQSAGCAPIAGFIENECIRACVAAADCEDLTEAACLGEGPLANCILEECLDLFACPNGELFPTAYICDGEPDCEGEQDEAGCVDFACEGADTIPQAWQCDGEFDCTEFAAEDTSDEDGCPTFTCATSGSVIPARWRCDFEFDCSGDLSDTSDEDDCPWVHRCDDDWLIPVEYVCDGNSDCPDASDEQGCGVFRCEDGSDSLPAAFECDGYGDCADDSDEADCGDLVCPAGS